MPPFLSNRQDSNAVWIYEAVKMAREASAHSEVPVGAVIVAANGVRLSDGFNHPLSSSDPTAHAEMGAIRQASKKLKNFRLTGATLYVSLQPCLMCLAAASHARIKKVVYAALCSKLWPHGKPMAPDAWKKLVASLINVSLCYHPHLESQQLLETFFQAKRKIHKTGSTIHKA